jgi:small subunit ribosomal protein S20
MANTKSAAKRARQTSQRTIRNRSGLSRLRTLQKTTFTDGKTDAQKVRALISAIDNAAKRGIIHRNAAHRRKARLQKLAAAGVAK